MKTVISRPQAVEATPNINIALKRRRLFMLLALQIPDAGGSLAQQLQ
jgi:hypothetical protein